MVNLIKNEFYKLLKSKRYYVFIGLILILVLFLALVINTMFNSNNISKDIIDKIKPYDFPLQMLGSMTDLILPIFVTLMITFFISDELVAATFKLPLLHGFKRRELLIAKVTTTIIATCVILIIIFFASYGIAFIMWGRDVFNTFVMFQTIKFYILELIPLISLIFIIISISLLLKNSGLVIGIMVALLVGSSIAGKLIPKVNNYLLTYYLKAFTISSIKLNITLSIIVCILYGAVFFILSNEVMKKLEIK